MRNICRWVRDVVKIFFFVKLILNVISIVFIVKVVYEGKNKK